MDTGKPGSKSTIPGNHEPQKHPCSSAVLRLYGPAPTSLLDTTRNPKPMALKKKKCSTKKTKNHFSLIYGKAVEMSGIKIGKFAFVVMELWGKLHGFISLSQYFCRKMENYVFLVEIVESDHRYQRQKASVHFLVKPHIFLNMTEE